MSFNKGGDTDTEISAENNIFRFYLGKNLSFHNKVCKCESAIYFEEWMKKMFVEDKFSCDFYHEATF